MKSKTEQAARLLSTAEVAKIVGCAPATAIRWAELGKHGFPHPAIEGGRGIPKRWHAGDIDDWLKSLRTR